MNNSILLYTDGACSNNQSDDNKGGWGFAIVHQDNLLREGYGSAVNTSNNRMEMLAAIKGLEVCQELYPSHKVVIHTDSAYLMNGMTNWIHGWIKKNWVNSKKEPVKNKDLWLRLYELSQNTTIEWVKVKGHSGDKWNEYVDDLAVQGSNEA